MTPSCRLLAQVSGHEHPRAHTHDLGSVECYLRAIEACNRAEMRIGALERQVKQLTQQASILERDAEANASAQAELKALHRHAFAEQPLEVAEGSQQVRVAGIKAELDVLTQRVATQERVAELLLGSVNAMAECKQRLKHALEAAAPPPQPPTVREALRQLPIAAATMHADAATMFMDQARRLDPAIAPSSPAMMAAPDFVSNMLLAHDRYPAPPPDDGSGEARMQDDSPRGPAPGLQVAHAEAMIFAAQLSTATHAAQARLFDAKAAAKRQAGVLHAERDALRMLRLTVLEERAGLTADSARRGGGDHSMTPRLTPRVMAAEGPAVVSGE